jgi:hypothetical protein
MKNKRSTSKGIPMIDPTLWIVSLYNSGIMNLLEIPHFDRGRDVNACVKQILECINGGFLWMETCPDRFQHDC